MSIQLEVFYDGLCPLCTKEINHYQKLDTKSQIDFIDISLSDFDDKKFGLSGRDYNKIFHVKKGNQIITGVDGFIAIWETLECFNLLKNLAKYKMVRPFFDFGYLVFAKLRPFFRSKDCVSGVCHK